MYDIYLTLSKRDRLPAILLYGDTGYYKFGVHGGNSAKHVLLISVSVLYERDKSHPKYCRLSGTVLLWI
jgi:hypothetical protein